MTKEKGIPQIRFSGFTDTWEQREVSNVAMISTGGTPSTAINEYWNPKQVPWLSSGEVHKKYITYTDDKISNEGLNHSSARMIKQNSVLIALAGQGKTRGTVAINRISLSTNQSIAAMTFAPDICPEFVFSNLESRYDELRKVSSGDGTRGGLNKQLVSEIQIPYTSLNEQRKIGQFFTHLDRLITLHQRKYDKLTKVKKAMLEKMFPKNGSLYPEIRFKGFTDAWEQRKLSAIADKVTEKNVGLQYIETFTNSAEFGIISQRDFFDHDIAKMSSLGGYYIVRSEDFVYNPRISTSAPVGPINRNKLGRIGVMSPLYTVFRPHDIDTTYLEYFFKSKYWHSFMNFNGDSGARSDRFSIKDSVFFEMPIPIPHIDEQKKIGEYLAYLDRLITLHQRKLEKLKNIKKACLEKMFV
ncbi:restriction endonuclease subunit S [Ruminococcus sp. TF12-2]|nr:restriction endonuclease subunit S [Ruminococcus sp. TF12-2]